MALEPADDLDQLPVIFVTEMRAATATLPPSAGNPWLTRSSARTGRLEDGAMAHIYFHYSTPYGVIMDRRGSDMEDLSEACERAQLAVHALIASPKMEDWRKWVLHVADGESEIFELPFSSVLGRLH